MYEAFQGLRHGSEDGPRPIISVIHFPSSLLSLLVCTDWDEISYTPLVVGSNRK